MLMLTLKKALGMDVDKYIIFDIKSIVDKLDGITINLDSDITISNFENEEDIELVLENIVLLELLSRDYEVHVGKTNQYEVDFVAEKKSESGIDRKYIQVSYLLTSEETREREFRALKEIQDNYEKTVLSMDNFTSDSDGIIHRNIVDWLLWED